MSQWLISILIYSWQSVRFQSVTFYGAVLESTQLMRSRYLCAHEAEGRPGGNNDLLSNPTIDSV